jgi:hypothetical protein
MDSDDEDLEICWRHWTSATGGSQDVQTGGYLGCPLALCSPWRRVFYYALVESEPTPRNIWSVTHSESCVETDSGTARPTSFDSMASSSGETQLLPASDYTHHRRRCLPHQARPSRPEVACQCWSQWGAKWLVCRRRVIVDDSGDIAVFAFCGVRFLAHSHSLRDHATHGN